MVLNFLSGCSVRYLKEFSCARVRRTKSVRRANSMLRHVVILTCRGGKSVYRRGGGQIETVRGACIARCAATD